MPHGSGRGSGAAPRAGSLARAGLLLLACAAATALLVNLVLNGSWTWLFFNRHKLGASALAAAALAASSADLTRRAVDVHPRVGATLAPYPLWCTFATLLSTRIWMLNRG